MHYHKNKTNTKKLLKIIYSRIKKKEQLKISDDCEEFILNICNNSIRLLINYMEKFKLLNVKVNEKKVKEICTNISHYEFEKYTIAWKSNKDIKNSIQIIFIHKKGYSVMDILDAYFIFIKLTKNDRRRFKI